MKAAVLVCLLAATTAARAIRFQGSYPAVAPEAQGTYQTGVSTIPDLGSVNTPCPAGFVASTDKSYLEMGETLLEAWFAKVTGGLLPTALTGNQLDRTVRASLQA
jgi:hypothetical protein